MDIEYEIGKDMVITLDNSDLALLRDLGFCTDRNGLVGAETKTWVRKDQMSDRPNALIDGASDVYVHLPNGENDLPARVEQADINPYIDSDRARIEFYFGVAGAIIVQAARTECYD